MPLAASGATVVCTDLSLGMLSEGHKRHPELTFVAGDALHLPYADGTFDTVTISFGLRNVENTAAALREMRRVTRPGGQIVICEFSSPTAGWFRGIYRNYLLAALPRVSRVLSSNAVAYDYLAESILAWPDQSALAGLMAEAGWHDIGWQNASGGIVALHRGVA